MQAAKEKASNVAASAVAGAEKTKATVQEKVDKMKAHDQADKAAAEQRKEERKQEAEAKKEIRKDENAEARATAQSGVHHATAGYGSGNTVTRTPVARERTVEGNNPTAYGA
ncbi:uncharacterized protein A4U43_C01F33450 [Asparagus officinalis]|uniref:Uncharacterized protein n=1 Tax=Asparagus officinalis TaxID=4686 RepID=A0A5P1FV17_ASPOF|nr:11 kDa late embryogenesis abundant protein-like [Asparagus officinalis]ONK81844.1 uncharacterized protein A4U43_C01F33450 [Asparagus officinalis]